MKNFTAFKAYVSIYDSIKEDVTDRFFNDRQKLKAQKQQMKEQVIDWCESNPTLVGTGYKVKFDQYCGCSCPCSPGFRVLVHERDVRNTGYTQLLWNRRGSRGPQDIFIDADGNVDVRPNR